MAEGAGFENRCAGNRTGGSNPPLSVWHSRRRATCWNSATCATPFSWHSRLCQELSQTVRPATTRFADRQGRRRSVLATQEFQDASQLFSPLWGRLHFVNSGRTIVGSTAVVVARKIQFPHLALRLRVV